MIHPREKIKPAVRALRAYSLNWDKASVKLNQNENPFDLPSRIKEEVVCRLLTRSWARYPDFIPTSLLAKLGQFSGWPSEGILVGNGSNELIQALLMVTLSEGKRVLICEPTFTLYRQLSNVLGAEVHSVALTPDLQFDIKAVLQGVNEVKPDVTIICSPNNPTGCVLSDSDLSLVLARSNGLVAVDEAYHEFAEHSVAPLLSDFQNLIVLRTFSKALALAGMRIGYLLGDPEIVSEIAKALLPYNLNVSSQLAAEVAIEMYEAELLPLIQNIISEKDRLFAELQKVKRLYPVESRANFIVIRSEIDPKRVFDELLKRDILVRDVSGYPMLANYFRLNVGTPLENDRLIEALKEICSG